jgi:chromosome segregation ATPase
MDRDAKGGPQNWLHKLLDARWGRPVPDARRRLAQLQEDVARLDDVTRARIERIRALDAAVRQHVGAPDVPGFARRALAEAIREMEPLARRAADLACRRGDLAALLENINPGALRRELSTLRVRREQAALTDPVLQAQLDHALRFKNEESAAYQAIEQTLRRVDGQLESVECAFAAFKARVLRLKAGDAAGGAWSETLGESLETDVETLSRQMDALDRSVDEALAAGRGGRI